MTYVKNNTQLHVILAFFTCAAHERTSPALTSILSSHFDSSSVITLLCRRQESIDPIRRHGAGRDMPRQGDEAVLQFLSCNYSRITSILTVADLSTFVTQVKHLTEDFCRSEIHLCR